MKKKDGFPGQMSFVLPSKIMERVKENPLISDLYITDIGYYPKAHYHFRERPEGCSQNILIYNVEGKGEIWLGSNRYLIPADHFFIIPAGVSHKYFSDTSDPWSIYWIHFTGSRSAAFSRLSPQPVMIDRNKYSRISERIELFEEIFINLERGYSKETFEYINLCLGRLLATFNLISQFRIINFQSTKYPVGRSINFMVENVNRLIYLEELARESGVSVSHYSRLFVQKTGHSPLEYFVNLKIQRACRLLDNTALTIAEIASEIGFSDQFYFSRIFHKVMNLSPVRYRDKLKG